MKAGMVVIICLSVVFGIWGFMSLIGGVMAAGGIVPLLSSWMGAVGLIQPIYTLVDFYTHIKAIEYIICAVFFVMFPIFFTYVNKSKTTEITT